MHFIRMNLCSVSKILAVWLFFNAFLVVTNPFSLAGEKEDMAAANKLIGFVESSDAGRASQAHELFDSIPEVSKAKPIAAYALALIQIREGEYSDAWKVLVAPSNVLVLVPDSMKIGKERLKLWLLLEAGAADKVEPQFKRLVTLSLGLDSENSDQIASCGIVGGVVGMLKCDGNAACIPLPILEKAKELLLTKVESKNAKAKLDEQLADARNWGEELSALVSKFESMGTEKADVQNRLTQAEFERTKQEQLTLRGNLKAAGGEKRDLDDQRKKGIQYQKVVEGQMKREALNRPAPPVNPGPQPRQPSKPVGSYKIDPKTQERKNVPPSSREEQNYKVEFELFRTWSSRVAKYQKDSVEYPAKIQLWEQRVASLQTQKKEADDAVASAENALKNMQANINQGVGNALKQNGDQLEQLERLAAISSIAFNHITSNDPKAKHLIRPSNFQLLDYDSECAQLRKSLR